MSNVGEQIKSIRQTLAGGYRKPDPQEVEGFCSALWKNEDALNYLKIKRGLTEETIKHFRLGYSERHNAISIPVFKGQELVNIRYRILTPDSNVRYTQEKGCEIWLYNDDGIERGKAKKGVLIVEGEFDLMSAWQAGFKNVVSPSSGKDSYGPWIELLDAIPRVYIAYDNDAAGKQASLKMAERVGVDKCFEVLYPDEIKDTNDYFLAHTADEFRELLKNANPYYKHKFSGVGDIVDGLRGDDSERLVLDTVPYVRWKNDWLGILAADKDGGKTTYALNIADELVSKDIPTLFLPFERGITEVGERYLQVRYNKQEEDLRTLDDEEFNKIKADAISVPLYFTKPTEDEFFDTILRAKRIFNTRFVIVDHLDYFVHGSDWVQKQADTVRAMKDFCLENEIIMIVVHHISKPRDGKRRTELTKEDLKGASGVYQIAEVVIFLYDATSGDKVIDVVNNKGKTGKQYSKVDMSTGRFGKVYEISDSELQALEQQAEDAWNF